MFTTARLPSTVGGRGPQSCLDAKRSARALPLFLAAALGISAGVKFFAADAFERALAATGFFGYTPPAPILYAIPTAELLAAAMLALSTARVGGALLSFFLGAASAAMCGFLYFNGVLVPVGCAGVQETPASTTPLAIATWYGAIMLAAGWVALVQIGALRRAASDAAPHPDTTTSTANDGG
ncbi:MAG: hypothetical protein IPM18_14905 [Phycisphaerales bacterium]|nr:hypothetical protein [Phycisphaerales bacterium]